MNRLFSAALVACMLVAGCGGDSATGPDTSGGSGPVPSALVGTWGLAAATGSQVCDDLGHCTPAYGGSESYRIVAGGSFVYSQMLQANLGGCVQTAFIYATGAASADAATLTLHPRSLRNRRTDTCGHDSDSTYTAVDPSTYHWRVATDGLYLTGSDGVEHGPFAPE